VVNFETPAYPNLLFVMNELVVFYWGQQNSCADSNSYCIPLLIRQLIANERY
jgi:hypothetical protein